MWSVRLRSFLVFCTRAAETVASQALIGHTRLRTSTLRLHIRIFTVYLSCMLAPGRPLLLLFAAVRSSLGSIEVSGRAPHRLNIMAIFNMSMSPEEMEEMLQRRPPLPGPQPLPKHVFNYFKCTIGELRKFLEDRKLCPKFRSRDEAALRLQNADRVATFRFLDLPPELRNHIYQLLLTLRSVPHLIGPMKLGAQPKCLLPEILATSKQVHKEARGLLYGENEFVVTFAADIAVHQPGQYQLKCEVCGLRPREWDGMYLMGTAEPISLLGRSVDWPDYLHRVEKLTVKIDLPLPPQTMSNSDIFRVGLNTIIALNRALYDLACFLLAKSEAVEITFDIFCEIDTISGHNDLAVILSPIRLFPAKRTFKLRHLAASIAASLQTPVSETTHITGDRAVTHVLRSLVREVSLYERLALCMSADFELDMERVREYCGEACLALGIGEQLNTPDTHQKLLDAVRELNAELDGAKMPVCDEENHENADMLKELRAIRAVSGR